MLLEVRDLTVNYRSSHSTWGRPRKVTAIRNVSLALDAGETLGVVGESGCGKSTLARAIVGLVEPSGGEVLWNGRDLTGLATAERQQVRRDVQLVFQDPYSSLNPRMRVGALVAEPLMVHERALGAAQTARRVDAMLEQVGLSAQYRLRYPHELSGGQCQRVAIARALVLHPRLLICDEPVSALDVSVQAQIVNLLKGLQRQLGLSMIFISHNLAVVRHVSTRVLVMSDGEVRESGDVEAIFARPQHAYTRKLLASVPRVPGVG